MANIGSIDIGSSFSTSGLGKGIKQAQSMLSGFAGTLSGAASAFTGFTAAIAANAAFSTLSTAVQGSMDQIDRMADLSQSLGTTVANLGSLQHAVSLTGSEAELLGPAIQKMSINLSKAGEDSKAAQEAFAKLGLDAAKLKEMDPAEAFVLVADAISQVPSQADRASYAMAVFGKSGVGLLNTLSAGIGAIGDLREQFRQMGLEISEVDAAAIGAAKDKLDIAGMAMSGLSNIVTVKLAPTIEYAATKFTELAMTGSGAAGLIDLTVGALNVTVFTLVKALNFVSAAINVVKGVFATFGAAAAEVLAFLLKGVDLVIEATTGAESNFSEWAVEARDALVKVAGDNMGAAGEDLKAFAGFGEAVEMSSNKAAGAVGGLGNAFGDMGNKVDEAAKKIQGVQDKLKDQIATFGMTSEQIEIYKLRQDGASAAVIANVQAMQRQLAGLEAQKKAQDDAKAIIETNLTPLEKYTKEMQKLESLKPQLGGEMFQRAAEKARKTLDEAMKPKAKEKEKEDPETKRLDDLEKKVKEDVMTPFQKYLKEIEDLNKIRGKLGDETYNRAVEAAGKRLDEAGAKDAKEQKSPFSNALELGSNEARAAILRNRGIGTKDPNKKIEENTKEQVLLARENNRLLGIAVNRGIGSGGEPYDFLT